MTTGVIKSLIKRRIVGNPSYTYIDVAEIDNQLSKLNLNIKILGDCLILFKPDTTYWIMLTTDSLYYCEDGDSAKISYTDITNNNFYERQLKKIKIGNEFQYDNLVLEVENQFGRKDILRFPIETGSIYSFIYSIPELIKNSRN